MARPSQTPIPCTLMRGGTSKGPFFLASDLPSDTYLRDRVLLAAMGSPDTRQIDGIGGADPLTSKAAIISRSSRPGVDVEYLFAQVSIDRPLVDVTPNCGNMLAGVGPFAIERGLVEASSPMTPVTIYMVNTGNIAVAHVPTPGGQVTYEGHTSIAGVPGKAAGIRIDFLNTAGSVCGALLPTGNPIDKISGIDATLIDNGMPVVVMRAADFGKIGYESPPDLDADTVFKQRLEEIRIQAGERMGLGDVRSKVVPKITLIAPPRDGGHVATRSFIPHKCHAAIGVLGAVTVGTACVMPGSVAAGIVDLPHGVIKRISVEHPSGEFSMELELAETDPHTSKILRASLIRTARALFQGAVLVPASIWDGTVPQKNDEHAPVIKHALGHACSTSKL
jgi:4-oxalomesaconate tautomerase